MMRNFEKELIKLIKIGKKSGDMKLRNAAQIALQNYHADDGTPGLGSYLWENYIQPNYKIALERAKTIEKQN